MKKNTQRYAVLHYMETHKKGITSKEAFEKFGVTRLSGIIFALKEKGYNIVSESQRVDTRYGKTTIACYKLVNDGTDR